MHGKGGLVSSIRKIWVMVFILTATITSNIIIVDSYRIENRERIKSVEWRIKILEASMLLVEDSFRHKHWYGNGEAYLITNNQ